MNKWGQGKINCRDYVFEINYAGKGVRLIIGIPARNLFRMLYGKTT